MSLALLSSRRRIIAAPPVLWEPNRPAWATDAQRYSDISWDAPLGGTTITGGWGNAGNNGGFSRVEDSSGGFGPWVIQCTSPGGWTGNGNDMGRIYTSANLGWRRFYTCFRHRFSATYECGTGYEKFIYPALSGGFTGQVPILNIARSGDGMRFAMIRYEIEPFVIPIGPRCLERGVWQTVEVEWLLNTANTNDGIMRARVDGVLCVEVLGWRAYQGAASAIDFWRYDTTNGGGPSSIPAPPEGNRREIDRISLYGAAA
jgi:hypothetical protein